MAAAIAFVHAGHGLLAKNGGWEYPATLLLVSLFFVVHGAGPLSIDAMLLRLREQRRGRPHHVSEKSRHSEGRLSGA